MTVTLLPPTNGENARDPRSDTQTAIQSDTEKTTTIVEVIAPDRTTVQTDDTGPTTSAATEIETGTTSAATGIETGTTTDRAVQGMSAMHIVTNAAQNGAKRPRSAASAKLQREPTSSSSSKTALPTKRPRLPSAQP